MKRVTRRQAAQLSDDELHQGVHNEYTAALLREMRFIDSPTLDEKRIKSAASNAVRSPYGHVLTNGNRYRGNQLWEKLLHDKFTRQRAKAQFIEETAHVDFDEVDRVWLRPVRYAVCKSGKRWFWAAGPGWMRLGDAGAQYFRWDYADLEEDAWRHAEAAARQLLETLKAAGPGPVETIRDGMTAREYYTHIEAGWASIASDLLKEVNREKRKERARKNAGRKSARSNTVTYIYCETYLGLQRHRVFKTTAKRIYYSKWFQTLDGQTGEWRDYRNYEYHHEDDYGFLDREKLAANEAGDDVHYARVWSSWEKYLEYQNRFQQQDTDDTPTRERLKEIRTAMHQAHPDKGGDHDEFIRLRKEYEQLRAHVGRLH